MDKNKVYLLFSCLSIIFLSGCWDQVQIEQRGFVIGSAIDMSEKGGNSAFNKDNQIAITYQFAAPGGMGGMTQGQADDQGPYFNLTAHGSNTFDITRDMATKTSRYPFFRHLLLIVLSSEVAETPGAMANTLDLFLRDHEMRRNIKVMITPDKARDIYAFKPANETLPTMAIDSITENHNKDASILPPLRLGEIQEFQLLKESFAIPMISMSEENTPQVKKAAVFHGAANRMVGVLDEEETKGLNIIQKNIVSASVLTDIDDHLVAYEVKDMKVNIKVKTEKKDEIQFVINIETEGNIAESFLNSGFTDPSQRSKIEEEIEKEMERLVNRSIEKLQNDLRVDAADLGSYVERSNYRLWTAIKDDWDSGENYFAKSTILVKTKALIRSSGAAEETEKN